VKTIATKWISDFGDAGNQFFVGDFNGDGRADVAAGSEIYAGEMSWNVATSDGTGFMDEGTWTEVFGSPDEEGDMILK